MMEEMFHISYTFDNPKTGTLWIFIKAGTDEHSIEYTNAQNLLRSLSKAFPEHKTELGDGSMYLKISGIKQGVLI